MRCPKCGHLQKGKVECERCGVIFGRYRMVRKRRKQEAKEAVVQREQAKARRRLGVFVMLCTVLSASLATLLYLNRSIPPAVEQDAPPVPIPVAQEPLPGSPAERRSEGNIIDRALSTTVTIRTPLGTGSGFFISPDLIVTNRHVVRPAPDRLKQAQAHIKEMEKYVDEQSARLAEGYRILPQLNGEQHRLLAVQIERAEKRLQTVRKELNTATAQVNSMVSGIGNGQIELLMGDGSSQTPASVEVSDNRDLALLTIYSRVENYMDGSFAGRRLITGEKVYALGSPVGLARTVTAGIFSGYRRNVKTEQLYLQTDAPINPGSSGGPLIDSKGCVQGVNTMIIRNTEGLGFAIPVGVIGEEFPGRI